MRNLFRTLRAWTLVLAVFHAVAACAANVYVIPIKGEISDARFYFLRRALKEAERNNASAVVLEMDTYGGELKACVKMQEALASVKCRTISYINPNAGSAGALIALSTREIYMAPISAIGASAPVNSGGEDLSETMKDKTVSYFSRYFRSVAERNGHNPDLAEAFINREKPVVSGTRTLHEKGSVLTLSAQQAVEKIDGKPLLAVGIADSMRDLLKQAKLTDPVHKVKPAGFEQAAFWITLLAPLFLLVGILGAWLEFKMPGMMLPGIISAICFAIFFAGHYLAGLAGWEAPVIFGIGLVLVIGELAIHPGTILPGMIGAAMMFGALLWAMVDRYPTQPLLPSSEELLQPVAKLGVALAAAGFAMALLAKYLPQTSFYHRLVLAKTDSRGPAFSKTHSEYTRIPVGALGVATSILRPSGKAEFAEDDAEGRRTSHDVISTGEFVESGTSVRVVAVEGSRIVVERVRQAV